MIPSIRLTLTSLVVVLSACGGDSTSPVAVSTPPPDVAGRYFAQWTLQVLRKSDGFQTQFLCYGTLTLNQQTASGVSTLSGFSAIQPPCAPESFDLTGSVVGGGEIRLTSGGPKPTQGPCPGGSNVHFSGQVIPAAGTAAQIALRGVTTVSCPQFGEHQFTYILDVRR